MSDDLIERLAGLGESMTALKLIGDLQDRIEALTAENERLREALGLCDDVLTEWHGHLHQGWDAPTLMRTRNAIHAARSAALGDTQ